MNYLLINGFLVNEGICKKADVYIKDRKIEKIFSSPCLENQCPPGATILDIQGCYLLPGIIDDQVHFREPGLTHKADIASESRAAVAGGVTSFMDMPNTIPQTLTQNLLQNKYERASEVSLANYSFYMGCSEDNLTEVLKTDPKQVCGIKLFLGSSTGNMLVQDPVYIENLLKNAPTLVAAHCEDENIIARNTTFIKQKYGEEPPFSIHPQIRSKEACYSSSSKIAEVARKTGARLHILHIST
ncbi:MAG: dihydroorotase, partial [Bacteroidales bacterium]